MIVTNFETLKNNKLVVNSAVFFIGSMTANFLNYLYHFAMGKMLGPADYGTLVTLISIIGIVSIPGGALTLAISKFSAAYKAEENKSKNKYLLLRASKAAFYVGIILFSILVLFSGLIANFLKIESVYLIILTGVLFILAYLPVITKGVITGWQRFKVLSIINLLETFIKLFSGILLVYLGWKVWGAISAFVISTICGYIFSFYPLRDIFKVSKEKVQNLKKEGFTFAVPALLLSLSIILFYSVDIILVKHFFESKEAGLYGALSTIGKIIFFVSTPISLVIFPMVAEKHAQKKKTDKYLLQGALIILALSFAALIFYFLIPNFIVQLLYTPEYSQISNFIGIFGLSMMFLSFNNLIGYYYLSINKKSFLSIFGLANISQIVLMATFHQSLIQIIYIQLFIMAALFAGLTIYYFKNLLISYGRKENINYYPGV